MKTQATAQENICKLPAHCYSILLTDKSLIRIVTGESGYYKMGQPEPHMLGDQTLDQFVDEWNNDMGVTKGQRKAMELGSMFGWNCPGANPDNYNEDGTPIKETV